MRAGARSPGAADAQGDRVACLLARGAPRTLRRDVHAAWRKKGATFEQLQAGAMICRSCHNAVHRLADNKTLAAKFYTVDLLMEVRRHGKASLE